MFNKQVVSGCCKTWMNWHTDFPLGLTCRSKHCKEQNKALVIQPVIIIPSCISGSLILKLLKAFLATLLSTMWLPETSKQKWPYQVRPKVHLTWSLTQARNPWGGTQNMDIVIFCRKYTCISSQPLANCDSDIKEFNSYSRIYLL